MKNIVFVIIFGIISFNVFSLTKTDANISGHVINKATHEHLSYINITVKGTTIGTSTDATGHFFLKDLPVGKFTIIASGVGFKMATKEVELVMGRNIEVNFEIEEDAVLIENVVVSANRYETQRKEASTVVNVISPKLFENTNSVCLAQGLSFQPGLRVESNCQNCGFQQVRINGLDGPYSQILIDSRAIFSSLAGVYGIEQIPTNMIERVEVVRGGGSALFGSNAIAGTINIITKEPTANSVTVSNTTNLIYGEKADVNTSFNASVVSDNYKGGVMIFGSSRQRSPFDYDGDGFTEIGKLRGKSVGFRGYYRTSNFSKITVEYHNLGEFRRGGNSLDVPPHESDITEQAEHNINTGSLKYDMYSKDNKHRVNLYASAQSVNRQSYYGAQKDSNAYGKTDDISFVGGMQYTYAMDNFLFSSSDLTLGVEYSYNHMKDEMLGYSRVIDQTVNTKSAFLQNEWKIKSTSILVGARVDKHNLIEDPIFSPRLNVRYGINEHINLRASYSGGFRAPQAFDEDLHVTAVGGNVALIRLASDLKTEKSHSYSASIDLYGSFGNAQANLLIEGFHTTLDNVFLLEEVGTDSDGNLILERRNGDGAVVKGVNFEGKIVPFKKLQVQFGATLQQSRYKKNQVWSDNANIAPQRKMFRSPDHYGYLTAVYQPVRNLSVSVSGVYTGSMLVQHFAGYVPEDEEKETSEFYDVNVKFAYDITINEQCKLQLNAGIQNTFNSYQDDFDKGEYRDAGYVYGPALPRTFFFGVKFSI